MSADGDERTTVLSDGLQAAPVSGAYLTASGVSFRYGRRSPTLFADVSFAVLPGQITVLEGQNGSGKSTLLEMCAGLRQPMDGTLERTAAFTYAPQATSSLQPNLTGYEHARLFEAAYARRAGHLVHAVEGVLQALQFDIRQLRTKVCHLSGGNRQKLNLSLALADERARLLLLDEPYAGFDASSLLAMMALFEQLLSDGKAIVMVNHLVDPRLRIDQSVHLGPT